VGVFIFLGMDVYGNKYACVFISIHVYVSVRVYI
jgi:hypothetical protein